MPTVTVQHPFLKQGAHEQYLQSAHKQRKSSGSAIEYHITARTMDHFKVWPGIKNLNYAPTLTRYAVKVSPLSTDTLVGPGNCPQSSTPVPNWGYYAFNRRPPYPADGNWSNTQTETTEHWWQLNSFPPPTYNVVDASVNTPVAFAPHLEACVNAINARSFSEFTGDWSLNEMQERRFDEYIGLNDTDPYSMYQNVVCDNLNPSSYTGSSQVIGGDYSQWGPGGIPVMSNHMPFGSDSPVYSGWIVDPRSWRGFHCMRTAARIVGSQAWITIPVPYWIAIQDVFYDVATNSFSFGSTAKYLSSGYVSSYMSMEVPLPYELYWKDFKMVDGKQSCGAFAFGIIGETQAAWQTRTGVPLV